MPVAIHLLGPPRIEIDHRDAPSPRGRKAWGLLAFLLRSRTPTSRERLAGLLFAEADDPLGALRWNLAELRRSLGPSVNLGGDPVGLALPAGSVVDVHVLASGTWVEAVQVPGLGRPLLEGIDVQAGAAFEAWLLAERREAEGQSAAVLREAATARLAAGRTAEAVELASRLVAIDEYDEEAHAMLIRALSAAGDPVRAREHLELTVARFRRDLGVEPSPTLRTALDASSAPEVSGPIRTQGPGAVAALVAAGEAAVGAGVTRAGLEILERAIVDARGLGDPGLEARALTAFGTALVHGAQGRSGEAATALHAAVSLAESSGARDLEAEACRELGYIEFKRAAHDRAVAWLERAIAAAPGVGTRANADAILGAVVMDHGQTARSIELLTSAVAGAVEAAKPRLEAWSLAFLGRSHMIRDERDRARDALERSMDVARGAGWMTFVAFPQSLLGEVELAEGLVDRATTTFEAAFALGCQVGDPCWEGLSARGLGLVHALHGRTDDAIDWLADARTRCSRISDAYLWVQAHCLDALCVTTIRHRPTAARAWVADLESLAARTGMSEMLVRALLHRAALGDEQAAEAARLFAGRIDNPVVLDRLAPTSGVAA